MIDRDKQLEVIQEVDKTITQMNVDYELMEYNFKTCLSICNDLAAVLIPARVSPVESLTSEEWLEKADAAIKTYSKLDGAKLPMDGELFRRGEALLKQITTDISEGD